MPLANGEVFAGYTIVRLLGVGGMGEVYLAQHPRLPRRDALKILSPSVSADPAYRERFIREADLAASLAHPNIVRVIDRGEFNGQLWISMDYVDGTDVEQLMRTRYPAGMPADEVVTIVSAVAGALDYAHQQGLLHRDVKPANILITQPNADGERRVFLADFGIARELADPGGLTATNLTVGTVAYAAPEQLKGLQLDGRADEYALAATTFHMFTGRPPFQQSNPVAVISQHLTEVPPKISVHRPELAAIDDVLSTALSKDPADRFDRCSQFANALIERLGGVSISSHATLAASLRPPASPSRNSSQKTPLGQRRILIGAAIAVVTVSVMGAVGYVTMVKQKTPAQVGQGNGQAGSSSTTVTAPTLDGTYRVDENRAEQTILGSPNPPRSDQVQTQTFWIALRSTCTSDGCVATSTGLDDNDHQIARTPSASSEYHFDGKKWLQVPKKARVERVDCTLKGSQLVPGSRTISSQVSWEPQANGSLRGRVTITVVSSECGDAGHVTQFPVTAVRVGDIPPTLIMDDPATSPAASPTAKAAPTNSGPELDGTYSLAFLNSQATVNGKPWAAWHNSSGSTDWYAFRSECTTTGCVATGALLDAASHQEAMAVPAVLRFQEGQWLRLPSSAELQCGQVWISGPAVNPTADTVVQTKFSLRPQPDGTLSGLNTLTFLGDGCNNKGMEIATPIVATRMGDVPPSVVLADPALFAS